MAQVTRGADIQQLRDLASAFDRQADALDSSVTTVTNAVQASVWLGPVAIQFKASWTQQHSVNLHGASLVLRSEAKTLRAEAQQQEDASGVSASSLGMQMSASTGVVSPKPEPATTRMTSAERDAQITSRRQELDSALALEMKAQADETVKRMEFAPGVTGAVISAAIIGDEAVAAVAQQSVAQLQAQLSADGRTSQESLAAYQDMLNNGTTQIAADMRAFPYQCTSWAWFRRTELGLPVSVHGAGGFTAGNTAEMYGVPIIDGSKATLGSLVSADGHVMVVEQRLSDDPPTFRISEMNVGDNSVTHADASEFRDTSLLAETPDGKWQVTRYNNSGQWYTTTLDSPVFIAGE